MGAGAVPAGFFPGAPHLLDPALTGLQDREHHAAVMDLRMLVFIRNAAQAVDHKPAHGVDVVRIVFIRLGQFQIKGLKQVLQIRCV